MRRSVDMTSLPTPGLLRRRTDYVTSSSSSLGILRLALFTLSLNRACDNLGGGVHACYIYPSDARDPCRDKRCSFGAKCVPSLDGLTARCQCPERCDNYGDSVGSTPICGTDGRDYPNTCEMSRSACSEMKDVEKKYDGKCDPCEGFQCPAGQRCKLDDQRRPVCLCDSAHCTSRPDHVAPVCGSDGRTYINECMLRAEACRLGRMDIRVLLQGECKTDGYFIASDQSSLGGNSACSSMTCSHGEQCQVDRSGKARCSCPPPCERVVRPVCGSNGRTFDNECELYRQSCLDRLSITVSYLGLCKDGNSDADLLMMSDEPMVNIDKPCKDGPCSHHKCLYGAMCTVRNNGQVFCECPSCNEEYTPVCASDGKTYSNECKLKVENCKTSNNLYVEHHGVCDRCRDIRCAQGQRCLHGDCVCYVTCVNVIKEAVCASDGTTYRSECEMRSAACTARVKLSVLHVGICEESSGAEEIVACNEKTCRFQGKCEQDVASSNVYCVCRFNCEAVRLPVCGSDGQTYGNICQLQEAACNKQTDIRRQPIENCQGIDEDLCDGSAPMINPATGLSYNCGRAEDSCPAGSYCHKLPTVAACCKEDKLSPRKCEDTTFGCCPDDTKTAALGPDGAGCPSICQCNPLGSYLSTCDPNSRQCMCKPGVGGVRCDRCEPTYWGLAKISEENNGCLPCNCHVLGSVRDDCEQMTGKCVCRPGIVGQKCTVCPNASDAGFLGCLDESAAESSSGKSNQVNRITKGLRDEKLLLSPSDSQRMISSRSGADLLPMSFDGQIFQTYNNSIIEMRYSQTSNRYEVRFRATSSDQGLLLLARKTSTVYNDFLAVAIVRGCVEVCFNLGKEKPTRLPILRSSTEVLDGEWHTLIIRRDNRYVELSVDYETPVVALSTPGANLLDTDGFITIGGSASLLKGLPATFLHGFVGCLDYVKLDDKKLDLISDRVTVNTSYAFCADPGW